MSSALESILIHTYNPDPIQRKQAEGALHNFLRSQGACLQILALIGDRSINRDIRQASSILLKNKIKGFFEQTDGLSVTPEERESVKGAILIVLISEGDNSIRGLLAESVRHVADTDYPASWPALLPTLLTEIQGVDFSRIYNSLLALRKVVKRYEYKPREERHVLDSILQSSFPILQMLMSKLADSNQIEAAEIMRVCFKIFYSATMYALPAVDGIDVNFWFQFLATMLQKYLPESSEGIEPIGQPIDLDERKKWPWWKLKKWISRIITNFIQRYGNPRYTSEEYKAFAQHFRANTAVALLGPVMNVLDTKVNGRYLTDDVHRMCLTYVCSCIEMSPTYKVLKPHIDYLLHKVIFPSLCLTSDEVRLFSEDPAEFVRKVHDPMEDWLDPRIAATNLLQIMARDRQKDTLPRILPFLGSILAEYNATLPETRDYQKKDGALVAVAAIAKILRESKAYSSHLETFLVSHVIPEFQSPVPFMRSRAFWIIDYFGEEDFSSPSVLQPVLQGLVQGLADPALPVQAAAAMSIRQLIEAEGTTELLRPVLPQLVGEYFRIMSEVENDAILSALQVIVEKFGVEIKGLAPMMITRLLEAFDQFAGAGTDDDEAAFSACQCLDTVTAVLDAVQDDEPALLGLEPLLLPLLTKLLTESDYCMEYLENCLTMMSYMTYYSESISPGMWSLCGPLLAALDDWGYDFMSEILAPILNYLTKGLPTFLQGHHGDFNFVGKLLKVVQKAFQTDETDTERDAKSAATMLTCLIECTKAQCPGALDAVIGDTLVMTLSRLQLSKSESGKIRFLEVAMALIYYNTMGTMQALEQLGPTASTFLFNTLFELLPVMERDSTERLVVLSFSSILGTPSAPMPQVVRDNVQSMFQQIIREVVLVEEEAAKARAKRESGEDEEEEDDEDEGEDEESGDGDDDDDDDGEGFDEDEDCVNAEDEAYQKSLEEIARKDRVKYSGGEPVDDEEEEDNFSYTSPIEKLDVLLFFVDAMQSSAAAAPEFVAALQAGLVQEDVVRLQEILTTGSARRAGGGAVALP